MITKLSALEIKAALAMVLEDSGKTVYDLEADLQKFAADKKKGGKMDGGDGPSDADKRFLSWGPLGIPWSLANTAVNAGTGAVMSGAEALGNLDRNMSLRDDQVGTVNNQTQMMQRAIRSLQSRIPQNV